MPSQLEAIIIADDLTGAADTGVQFSAIGSPVYVLPTETLAVERPWLAAARGLSIYTSSRALSARAAAERVHNLADRLLHLRPRRIYKKIDSCLRGNLGAEIDVLLDVLGLDAALVAPALPVQGRTTVGGIHYVHGTPLAQTALATDLVAPAGCSEVADVLKYQSRFPVGAIGLSDYGDEGQLRCALRRERGRGHRLIVCDAATQGHLDRVAALAMQGTERLLPVGSAGLAAGLVRLLSHAGLQVDTPPGLGVERLLAVCGTASPVTRLQVDRLLDGHPGVRCELAPQWLLESSPAERRRHATELLDGWNSGVMVLQIGAPSHELHAVSPQQVAVGLDGLAALAFEVIRASRADRLCLLLTGGETAEAVRRAAGSAAIRLEGELLPGLVLGRWLGGVVDGLPVVTKAGAFGTEKTLVALYERLSAGAKL